MPQGITVVTTWVLKPDLADTFVELLAGMLPDTRLHKGFRSIRLLPIAEAADQSLLIQEWDAAEDFHAYARFRNEAGGGEKLLAMTTSAPQTSLWLTEPLASAKV